MCFFKKKKKKEEIRTAKVEEVKTEDQTPTEQPLPQATSTGEGKKVSTAKTAKAPAKAEKAAIKTEPVAEKTEEKTSQRKSLYRVIYDKEARVWVIKKDGAKRNIASFTTKEEAVNRVKQLSSSQELNFVVHKKDGKFQKK